MSKLLGALRIARAAGLWIHQAGEPAIVRLLADGALAVGAGACPDTVATIGCRKHLGGIPDEADVAELVAAHGYCYAPLTWPTASLGRGLPLQPALS